MLKLFAALGALATIAAPALADETKKPRQLTAETKPDRMVCKVVKDIRWRTLSSKVCFPASKWRDIARETQFDMDDYGRAGSFGSYN